MSGRIFTTEDATERKSFPMAEGLLDYFPDALAYVAYVSKMGNDQHNPGKPIHWARGKSTDHANCIIRHLSDRGLTDLDSVLHSGKLAWRALALLQMELEEMYRLSAPRGTSDAGPIGTDTSGNESGGSTSS